MARKATAWIEDWIDSASPSSGLDEELEDEEELDEWDEQLVESDEVRHELGELDE